VSWDEPDHNLAIREDLNRERVRVFGSIVWRMGSDAEVKSSSLKRRMAILVRVRGCLSG